MANPSRKPTQGMFVLRVTHACEDETARYASLLDLARAIARLVLRERARWSGPPRVGRADTFRESFGDSGRILRIAMRPDLAAWCCSTNGEASTRCAGEFARPTLEIEAFGRAGRRLRLLGLIGAGVADLERQQLQQRLGRWLKEWSGQGPVPGTGRGRRRGTWRRFRTAQERRHAAHVMHEEGELGPRACRETVLPAVWDDRPRPRIKCWKAQHKGRKAWDR